LQDWKPLTSLFKSEIKCEKEFHVGSLQSYKIPKLKDKYIESGADIENSLHSAEEMKTLSSRKRKLRHTSSFFKQTKEVEVNR
jgi:hypothetical protein